MKGYNPLLSWSIIKTPGSPKMHKSSKRKPITLFLSAVTVLSYLCWVFNDSSPIRRIRTHYLRVYAPDWRKHEEIYVSNLISPAWIGISQEYKDTDFTKDRAAAPPHQVAPYDLSWLHTYDNTSVAPASLRPDALTGKYYITNQTAAFNATADIPLTPPFQGTDCLVHYPNSSVCPFPGMCAPAHPLSSQAHAQIEENGQCLHWKSGLITSLELGFRAIKEREGLAVPKSLDKDAEREYVNAIRAKRRKSGRAVTELRDWDIDGRWEGEFWHPIRDHFDEWRFFTPSDIHQCFAGKSIVLQGDSIVRQLYERIVNYVRGLPTHAEKYYHFNSTYTVFLNGTDQYLAPSIGTLEDKGLYTIAFDWHGFSFNENFRKYQQYEADHALVGLNYWWREDFDFWVMRKELDKLFGARGYEGTLSWYATPPRNNEKEEKDVYAPRNRVARQHVAERRWQNSTYRMNVVPVDKLYDKGLGWPFERNFWPYGWRDFHTGCATLAESGLETIPGIHGLKMPKNFDCRDMTSFNVMQVWLNSIC